MAAPAGAVDGGDAPAAPPPHRPPRLVALCINLDRATARWRRVVDAVAPALAPIPVHRLPAVDGRALSDAELAAVCGAHARWSVRHRPAVCDRTVLNTREAVGCYLSHRRAWAWLAAHGHAYDAAVVLEDDACPEPGLAAALVDAGGALAPLVRPPPAGAAGEWDVVWLGYADVLPAAWRPPRRPVRLAGGVDLRRPDAWCYGAHCYLLSPAGARRLLARALPAELHVDFWLQVLALLGDVRGFFAPRSWAGQCRRTLEPGIPHFAWAQVNWKVLTPDVTVRAARRALAVAAVLVVVVVLGACWRVAARRAEP